MNFTEIAAKTFEEIPQLPKKVVETLFEKLESSSNVEKPNSIKEREMASNYIKNIESRINVEGNWRNKVKEEGIFSDKILEQIGSNEEYEIYKKAGLCEVEINDKIYLVRKDIDWSLKDDMGRTNIERTKQGLAPIKDGKPLELHHIGQHKDSPLAELTNKEHHSEGNDTILHDKNKVSEINRNEFAKERIEYWKSREDDII